MKAFQSKDRALLRLREIVFPVKSFLFMKPATILRFRNEHRVLKGELAPHGQNSSALLFTTHKSASTFFPKFLETLARENSVMHLDFDSYFGGLGKPVNEEFRSDAFIANALYEKGAIYGPMRSPRVFPDLQNYNIVLVLRDPRDVLVSLYYSMAYSHSLMSKRIFALRRKALTSGIDSFVSENTGWLYARYDAYRTLMQEQEHTLFLRYGDLMSTPEQALVSIARAWHLRLPQDHLRALVKELTPKMQGFRKHRRSGETKQFEYELKPATTSTLTKAFSPILKYFGFE